MAAINQLYEDIGRCIKSFRTKLKMSQTNLAISIGLKRTSIVHIEKGEQRISIDSLYLVAKSLSISVYDLLPKKHSGSDSIDEISKEKFAPKQLESVLKHIRN